MRKERHLIFELGDNQSWSTLRNSSRTFNFHNVYQRYPRKNEEDVLQFAEDTCIICHSKSDENLFCKINSVFEHTDSYMRQNMLTLNRDKTEIVVFQKMVNQKLNNCIIMEFP